MSHPTKIWIFYEILILLIGAQLLDMAGRFYLDGVGMPLTQHERTYGGSNGVTIK